MSGLLTPKGVSVALRYALATFEGAGHVVRGLRLHPNGAIDLLTESPVVAPMDGEGSDWVELAGAAEISRA